MTFWNRPDLAEEIVVLLWQHLESEVVAQMFASSL